MNTAPYAPIAEIRRGRRDPEPAYDQFTAEVPAPNTGFTLGACRRVLDAFLEAGVPHDAQIQWSFPCTYAHWRREVL